MAIEIDFPSGGSGLPLTGGTLTGPIVINGGTVIVSTPLLTQTQTWDDGGVTFHLDTANVTNTASAAASTLLRRQVGGSTVFSLGANGKIALLAQAYPSASISSTANSAYGFGFSGGLPNLVANNKEAAAGCVGGVNGANQSYLGATALMLAGFGSAPSGTGVAGGVLLSMLNANELTIGYTHATTATNQTVKAHDVTTGTGADLILSGGTGSVANGNVIISKLPTSNPGPGILWNNAGTPAIGT